MNYAVVTGASTGIGRAVSVTLASHGYVVYLLARRKHLLEEIRELILSQGGQAECISADLSSVESVNHVIDTIKKSTQSIDVLANIAGIWHNEHEVFSGKNYDSFQQQVILDTFSVGIIAPALFAHAFIPFMKQGGKIVNVSGTFNQGAKGWIPYYVSKRAIEDLTIALSQELVEKHIQVNCISPSDTATEAYKTYFPQYIDEAILPDDIAQYVLKLVNPDNSMTGKVMVMKKGIEPYEGFHS